MDVLNWIRANDTEVPREDWQGNMAAGSLIGRGEESCIKLANKMDSIYNTKPVTRRIADEK